MSTNFPTGIDTTGTSGSLPVETSTTPLSNNHVNSHQNLSDAIIAVQTYLGIIGSAITSSITYLLTSTSSINPGHKHTVTSVSLSLDDLNNVTVPSPSTNDVLQFNGTSWVNNTVTGADASTTVKGVTKLSIAPVLSTSPIAVGDNDGRVPTQNENDALVGTSGTAVSSSNKLVDAADVSSAAASGKIVRAVGTALPALDGSNLTNITPLFVAGVISDLATTATGNNDSTVTTTFTPRLIRLHYWIQGHATSGNFNSMKGILVYNGTTLVSHDMTYFYAAGSDGGLPLTNGANISLGITPSSTTTPTVGDILSSSSGGIVTTLSIASVSSTNFVIRRTTTISGTNSNNARASISYEAYV